MTTAERPEQDPYELVDAALRREGVGYATSKTAALSMHARGGHAPPVSDALFAAMVAAFHPGFWASPRSATVNNWRWRTEEEVTAWRRRQPPVRLSPRREVELERDLVANAGLDDWTYQMSTMSGLVSATGHGRRAIDLVHRIAPGRFEFIELKTDDKTPLHAAFEILRYGLAWCLARQHPERHREVNRVHDLAMGIVDDDHVLDARHVDLVVLAPASYYDLPARGSAPGYRLQRFAESIERGLASVVARLPGVDAMSFAFRSFEDGDSLIAAAKQPGAIGKAVA